MIHQDSKKKKRLFFVFFLNTLHVVHVTSVSLGTTLDIMSESSRAAPAKQNARSAPQQSCVETGTV